jgi:hypothetical protein
MGVPTPQNISSQTLGAQSNKATQLLPQIVVVTIGVHLLRRFFLTIELEEAYIDQPYVLFGMGLHLWREFELIENQYKVHLDVAPRGTQALRAHLCPATRG